jgi:hypothetical protein
MHNYKVRVLTPRPVALDVEINERGTVCRTRWVESKCIYIFGGNV